MNPVVTPFGTNVLVLRESSPPPAAWFTSNELERASTFRLPKRRDEYLLSRAAAKQLALDLGICSEPQDCGIEDRRLTLNGQPSDWRVSLSHSAPYAGATISRDPVGVDVQVVRPFDDDAARLFLADAEIAVMLSSTIAHRLLHFWCAKEAAWKRHSPRYQTLRQVPLVLLEQLETSLRFDDATTITLDDVIVAFSAPLRQ